MTNVNLFHVVLLSGWAIAYGGICNELLNTSQVLSSEIIGGTCGDIGVISPTTAFTTKACFDSGSNSSNSFSILTASPFILRRVEFVPLTNTSELASVRIATADPGLDRKWYVSPSARDMDAQWTELPVSTGAVNIVPDVLPFSNITVWATGKDGPINTKVSMYGCWADDAQTVDYLFNSTERTVEQRFSAIQFFESIIVSVLAKTARFDPTRVSLRLVDTPASPGAVTIRLTVLPDPSDSQSVADIVSFLTKNEQLLNALSQVQTIITDNTAILCFDKICPVGTFCVSGKCRSQEADAFSAFNKPNFASMRAYAPNILATESTTEDATTPWYKAYFVPLLIGGASLVLLAALVIRQWWKRTR